MKFLRDIIEQKSAAVAGAPRRVTPTERPAQSMDDEPATYGRGHSEETLPPLRQIMTEPEEDIYDEDDDLDEINAFDDDASDWDDPEQEMDHDGDNLLSATALDDEEEGDDEENDDFDRLLSATSARTLTPAEAPDSPTAATRYELRRSSVPVSDPEERVASNPAWSFDDDDDEEPEVPVAAPVRARPAAPAPAPAAKVSAGRAKTRLLGFSGLDEEDDPFAQPVNGDGQAPTLFPVGWLVVVDGPGRGSAFSLHNGVSQIGRGDGQTIRLDFGDMSISRENHAAIAYDPEPNEFFIGHGGKANIVRCNGKPVLSTQELNAGDTIRIGETTLQFVPLCGPDFRWSA